ncbi:MAG: hypothetical protein ABFD16_23695 [Thermoguttaceae bacterium]|jgi:hypothetical protein
MWLKWLPWRYVVSRAAQARGFVDPVTVMSRLHRFSEPSEVAVPLELLRAGVIFHSRGLINTQAIQHNLDWVWPYWVERQFNPRDSAFIPRAFSITHVNLTCRNWTAVGVPNVDLLPIVDPRGLVTPHWDGWSLDGWILTEGGLHLLPSQSGSVQQRLDWNGELAVVTQSQAEGLQLESRTSVAIELGRPVCRQIWRGSSATPAWLVVSLRPYNPEGVSFIHRIELDSSRSGWTVDRRDRVLFSRPADRHLMSDYRHGDVYLKAPGGDDVFTMECEVGMATAAAMFALEPAAARSVEVTIPLARSAARSGRRWFGWRKPRRPRAKHAHVEGEPISWRDALANRAVLQIPDARLAFLYEAAIRSLVLHTPGEVYPGPYTYKRFWVRDTAFLLHALLCMGLIDRVENCLPHLLARQTGTGYFLSQEGEWDTNGEALWLLWRYANLSGRRPPAAWRDVLRSGGRWIVRKRVPANIPSPHAGLLPAGFSAEHLGTNNYYYWDDFWAVGGLRAAASLLEDLGDPVTATSFRREADDLLAAIDRSLKVTADRRSWPGIPASPYRRMDPGAIGSLVAGYPLGILPPDDPRLLATAAVLREHFFVEGGFFQDMIHSGINPYLTLHVAQVLLRGGDPDWFELVQAVARLASPTGQWPEAIHPHTGGGCMGDGQHAWASAEWVMAIRNAFVREEGNRLIVASGIPSVWLDAGAPLLFGPAPTPWGDVIIQVKPQGDQVSVSWEGTWRGTIPPIEVRLVGCPVQLVNGDHGEVLLPRNLRP